MMQFCLVSLIPGLIANLQDAADPSLDSYAQSAKKTASLRTSDRSSCAFFELCPGDVVGVAYDTKGG